MSRAFSSSIVEASIVRDSCFTGESLESSSVFDLERGRNAGISDNVGDGGGGGDNDGWRCGGGDDDFDLVCWTISGFDLDGTVSNSGFDAGFGEDLSLDDFVFFGFTGGRGGEGGGGGGDAISGDILSKLSFREAGFLVGFVSGFFFLTGGGNSSSLERSFAEESSDNELRSSKSGSGSSFLTFFGFFGLGGSGSGFERFNGLFKLGFCFVVAFDFFSLDGGSTLCNVHQAM